MLAIYIGSKNIDHNISKAEAKFQSLKFRKVNNFREAEAYIINSKVSIVFIEIDKQEDGKVIKDFIRLIKKHNNKAKVLAVSGTKDSAYEAIKFHFDNFLLYPVSQFEFEGILDQAISDGLNKNIFIRTMPEFQLSVDGKVINFSSNKAKELLAFLIDAEGMHVSNNQIINALWEDSLMDETSKSRCRVTYHNLKETLKKAGIEFILGKGGRYRNVNPDTFTCDFYELLAGDERFIRTFNDRYLESYSWAEATKGKIVNYLTNINRYNPVC